jgi:TetR/AcrR family transcriptional repressor of mexJK operon
MASAPAILDAAATLFLRGGYLGTSVDAVAELARVSKQTIYTHFGDKERLFREVVLRNSEAAEPFIASIEPVLAGAGDLETGLRELARRYLAIVLRPEVVSLRRLVIGEAAAFPELAREYHERVPQRVLDTLTVAFERRARSGELGGGDARRAAEHYAFLVIGALLDRAMFTGEDRSVDVRELEAAADAGVRAFLAAHGL